MENQAEAKKHGFISENSQAFSFRVKESGMFIFLQTIFSMVILIALFVALIHWYELTLLLTGQVTPIIGGSILALFIANLSFHLMQNKKKNRWQFIEVSFNAWLAKNYGLVSDESFSTLVISDVEEHGFTDMNGENIIRKILFNDDWKLEGPIHQPKKVLYCRIALD